MTTLFDYLSWRGDLPLSADPFYEVDGVILARFTYMPFHRVLRRDSLTPTTVEAVCRALLALPDIETAVRRRGDTDLLRALVESPRYKGMELTAYADRLDAESQTQFSAITVKLEEGHYCVAYRGTDNTLIGWKEDFNMAFRCPVPAQESAARYVDEAADAIGGPLLCGGHSKGGNLAVYGAAMCSDVARERIERVYSHDGPGFVEEFLNGNAFADLSGRIDKTLPRSSIFGMMFETQEDYAIVESTEFSLLQHNPFSWVVDGRDFVYCERLSAGARYVDGSIREMLLAVSPSERERFVDALFSVFEATGAERFADIAGNLRESLPVMLQAAQGFDEDTRRFVSQTIVAILKCALLPKRPQIDMPAAGKSLAEQLEAWQSELLR